MKFNIAILGLVLVAFTSASAAANKTWTGSVNTEWHEPGNWSPPGVPAGNDTINIMSGSVNASPPVTIASGGTLNWTGSAHGYLSGGLTIASGGAFNVGLEGGYSLGFYGGVTNAGTIRWTNGILYVAGGSGGVIVNQLGGLMDAQSEYYISGDGPLLNAGTFRKSAGSGTTIVYVPLTNTGIVEALSGTISLNGGGPFEGNFHAAAGAAIQLGGGAFTYSTLPSFTGPGDFRLAGATLTLVNNLIPGLQMISGTVILSPAFQGGTITNLSLGGITLNGNHTVSGTLNGSGIQGDLTIASGATVNLSGGSISGNQTVASGGTLNLSGGTMSGYHTIASGGTLNWTGSAHGYLSGGLTIASGGAFNVGLEGGYSLGFYGGVTNAGTIRWTNGILYVAGGSGGVIVNQLGGLMDAQSEYYISGDGPLLNTGTFRKSAGSGTTIVYVPLTNIGIVEALSGTISLNGGGPFEGNFHAAAGAAIQLGGGAFTYSTLPSFTGPGDFRLAGATLTLVNNPIPGLQMISGTVILNPAFQGGTITNLSLGGITLNGNHTVSGTLNGSGIQGDLTIASGATVNLSGGSISGNQTIASGGTLNLSGGTMSGYHTIASGGTLNWTGSAHASLSGGLTIANGGVLNVGIEGGYALNFYGGVTNAGTLRWTDGYLSVYTGNGGVIVNQPGGIIDAQSEYYISGDGPLLNAGTFRKSAGSGTTIVYVPLTNTGIVEALSGTISLNGGGPFEGNFHAAAGAAIQLGGGAFTYSTLPSFTGPGDFRLAGATLTLVNNPIPGLQMISGTVILNPAFQGGTITNLSLGGITLSGNYTVSGTLNLSGGSISGNQTIASGGTLNLSGGTMSGYHTIASGGTLNWTGSAHASLSGGLTIANGGVLNVGIEGGYALNFYGGVTNAGTLRWTDGYLSVYTGNGGVIVNQPGGIIDAQSEYYISGDGPLLNAGTFRKSAGSGTTIVYVPLTNTGIVEALSGTISLNGGGPFEGNFHAAAGAAIQLGGGAFTYSTLPSFTGPGDFRLAGATLTLVNNPIPGLQMISGTVILNPAFQGGTITNLSLGGITLSGNYTVSGTLNLSEGSISGNQTIASGGTLNLSGGTMSGYHTIASGGTLNWTGSAHASLSGGLTIANGGVLNVGIEGGYALNFYGGVTNAGTLRWTDGYLSVYTGNGGVIVNQPGGIIDAQSEYYISGDSPLLNAGTFRKSAGSGTTTVYVPLTNTGTVQALSGTISFQGSFSEGPSATLAISIGGVAAGTDYGHIHFASPLALNGSFTASTRNGFHPNPGDTFDVLSYPSFTGDFNCFSGVNLGGGIWLAPTITQNHMVLTAVAYGINGVPAIFATRWPGGLRLFRTPGFPDWELVTTTNLFAPVWTPVPLTGCDQVTLPATAPAQFFRLRKNN